jgi:hypothetical protein
MRLPLVQATSRVPGVYPTGAPEVIPDHRPLVFLVSTPERIASLNVEAREGVPAVVLRIAVMRHA